MNEWFARWFGKEYLYLYAHRGEREANAMVRLIRNLVAPDPGGRALDLACGSGRHTRSLSENIWTVGLDLSLELLEVGRAEAPSVPFVRADMRQLPFAASSFNLVVNLFTSFGYFSSDEENRVVLAEVRRVLHSRGVFVLDYLNADHVRTSLVPFNVQQVRDMEVTQRRRITDDGRYVEKTITRAGSAQSFMERVRLFDPEDLRCLLHDAGFTVTRELGEYSGASLSAGSSRAIFFAHPS